MKCDEYQLLIGDMVDGEPWNPRSAYLFTHMAECTECQRFLRHLLKLRNIEAESALEDSVAAANAAGHFAVAARTASAPGASHDAHKRKWKPDRSPSGILRRQIRMSVSSAAVTLVMLIVWSGAVSFTLMSGGNSAGRSENDQFPQNPVPHALMRSEPGHSTP